MTIVDDSEGRHELMPEPENARPSEVGVTPHQTEIDPHRLISEIRAFMEIPDDVMSMLISDLHVLMSQGDREILLHRLITVAHKLR